MQCSRVGAALPTEQCSLQCRRPVVEEIESTDGSSVDVEYAQGSGLKVKNTFLESDAPHLLPFADALPPPRRCRSCPARRPPQIEVQPPEPPKCCGEASRGLPDRRRNRVVKIMLQNIPNRATRDEVLQAIGDLGFGQSCTSLQMPMAKKGLQNLGYAFAGIRGELVADEFIGVVEVRQYGFPRHPESKKILQAVKALRKR